MKFTQVSLLSLSLLSSLSFAACGPRTELKDLVGSWQDEVRKEGEAVVKERNDSFRSFADWLIVGDQKLVPAGAPIPLSAIPNGRYALKAIRRSVVRVEGRGGWTHLLSAEHTLRAAGRPAASDRIAITWKASASVAGASSYGGLSEAGLNAPLPLRLSAKDGTLGLEAVTTYATETQRDCLDRVRATARWEGDPASYGVDGEAPFQRLTEPNRYTLPSGAAVYRYNLPDNFYGNALAAILWVSLKDASPGKPALVRLTAIMEVPMGDCEYNSQHQPSSIEGTFELSGKVKGLAVYQVEYVKTR